MATNTVTYYLNRIEMFLLCAVAFLIPVHVDSSPIIIAMLVLLFLIKPGNMKALKESVRTTGFWAMIIPFVLYLIGILYSDDTNTALHNTETALSLMVFPLIATSFRQNDITKKTKLIEISLIAGILTIMTISIAKAAISYAEIQNSDVFFYTQLLSSPHHHSYYALFAVIVLTQVLLCNWDKLSKWAIAANITLALIVIVFIGMLSSKITILLLGVYVIYLIIKLILSKSVPKWLSVILAIATIAAIPAFFSLPMVKYRIDNMMDSIRAHRNGVETVRTRNESTTIRIKCMSSAMEVISENWLYGTGQGDVYAEMQKQMKKRMGEDYEGTCSPHNQFLRSFASFGIIGIASLIFLFIVMFKKAIKSRNGTIIWWCIITLCFFCIEDMLCIINGIIFFCMFTGIMLLGNRNEELQH